MRESLHSPEISREEEITFLETIHHSRLPFILTRIPSWQPEKRVSRKRGGEIRVEGRAEEAPSSSPAESISSRPLITPVMMSDEREEGGERESWPTRFLRARRIGARLAPRFHRDAHARQREGAFDKYCFPWTPAKLERRTAIFSLSLPSSSLLELDLTGIV